MVSLSPICANDGVPVEVGRRGFYTPRMRPTLPSLTPGMHGSELRVGLYPQPPDLSRQHVDPRVAFWVIKHGIKMSAMPAWGSSHDDATIWSMVAFLQKLPAMTPDQYKAMVAKAPPDDDMDMDPKDMDQHK